METRERDIIWMVKIGTEPWKAVTKEEWVSVERRAGFRNTMGKPNEPGTASFDHREGRRGKELKGTQIDVEYFDVENYTDEPELRDAIVDAIKNRILDPANATPPRRYTDAYDVGQGTAGP